MVEPQPYTAALEADEMAALCATWGEQPVHHHELAVDHPFLTGENQLLVGRGRRAEICYVMHRGDPAAGVLLHIKTFYPTNAYRLPTGGVHVGETVMETLSREIEEETGMPVTDTADGVQVERCLGVLTYAMPHRRAQTTFAFATYHFLVRMPENGVLAPRDPEERIGGWRWCAPADLLGVADYLDAVGTWQAQWADWGHYRALSHRFVAQALAAL